MAFLLHIYLVIIGDMQNHANSSPSLFISQTANQVKMHGKFVMKN